MILMSKPTNNSKCNQKEYGSPLRDQYGNDLSPHGNTERQLKCSWCEYRTRNYDDLAWHITTEHNENYKHDPDKFMGLKK